MQEQVSILTRKGQVTVPSEIRRALRLVEGDRIAFTLEGGAVRLVKRSSVTEQTAGIFQQRLKPLSAERLRSAAERAIAEDVRERMSR